MSSSGFVIWTASGTIYSDCRRNPQAVHLGASERFLDMKIVAIKRMLGTETRERSIPPVAYSRHTWGSYHSSGSCLPTFF